jgi:hypothetical protein
MAGAQWKSPEGTATDYTGDAADMRHLARVVGVAVVSAISSGLFLLADSQDQDPPRIRAGIDLVHFDVTVTDKTGTLVEGLTADDFECSRTGLGSRSVSSPPDTAMRRPIFISAF